jgi:Tfp pilus assembly protein FimV
VGADVSHSCYIGNIVNQSSPSGLAVFVNSDNKLGTIMSSRRFKDDIKPMDKASEAVLALQPVTFRYKKDFDPTGTTQFGLVAEDVAKVNPDLVVRDKEGKPYSVRYDQVNAMLLNEFLKERKEVERTIAQLKSEATKQEAARNELESTIAQQQKAMEVLTAQLQEQAAQIQRVSAQLAAASPSRGGLELNKFAAGGIRVGGPAPQTVCLSAVALREGGNNP